MFLEAEKNLKENNGGVTPSDEEILTKINDSIKTINKDIYKLKKEGFFNRYRPFYRHFKSYYIVYLDMFNVDFFKSPESDWYNDLYISRQKEKDQIEENFYYKNFEELYENMLDQLDDIETSKVILKFYDCDEECFQIGEFKAWFNDINYIDSECVYDKAEAIEMVKRNLENYKNLTEEEYLEMVLAFRKRKVQAELKRFNDIQLQENLEIKEKVEKYERGDKFFKYWTIDTLNEVKGWIAKLFNDDVDFFSQVMLQDNARKRYTPNDCLEDEVESNFFLDDYYNAIQDLPENEREVMLQYYDQFGYHNQSAKLIADNLSITPAKVYQTKEKALKRLRQNKNLQGYLD